MIKEIANSNILYDISLSEENVFECNEVITEEMDFLTMLAETTLDASLYKMNQDLIMDEHKILNNLSEAEEVKQQSMLSSLKEKFTKWILVFFRTVKNWIDNFILATKKWYGQALMKESIQVVNELKKIKDYKEFEVFSLPIETIKNFNSRVEKGIGIELKNAYTIMDYFIRTCNGSFFMDAPSEQSWLKRWYQDIFKLNLIIDGDRSTIRLFLLKVENLPTYRHLQRLGSGIVRGTDEVVRGGLALATGLAGTAAGAATGIARNTINSVANIGQDILSNDDETTNRVESTENIFSEAKKPTSIATRPDSFRIGYELAKNFAGGKSKFDQGRISPDTTTYNDTRLNSRYDTDISTEMPHFKEENDTLQFKWRMKEAVNRELFGTERLEKEPVTIKMNLLGPLELINIIEANKKSYNLLVNFTTKLKQKFYDVSNNLERFVDYLISIHNTNFGNKAMTTFGAGEINRSAIVSNFMNTIRVMNTWFTNYAIYNFRCINRFFSNIISIARNMIDNASDNTRSKEDIEKYDKDKTNDGKENQRDDEKY